MMQGSYLIPLGFNFIEWMSRYIFNPIISLIVTILKPIFTAFLKLTGDLFYGMFASVLYDIYTTILTILDLTQYIFDRLSGVQMVHKDFGVSMVLGSYLTNYFVNLGVVRKAFWGITALCLILCFVFTLVAVARASIDLSGKFAVGEVLRKSMRAFLTFFLLQVFVLASMTLANKTLTAIDSAISYSMGNTSGSEDLRMANIIFVSSAIKASKDNGTDIFKDGSNLNRYYKGSGSSSQAGLPFNSKQAYDDFDIAKIDYLIGYASCVMMVYVMLSSIFFFVQRVFEVVFLYLVSPFFVASMPLDGGSRFNGWKEMFLAKCIASYGVVITMRLFFIFVPVMMGGESGVQIVSAENYYLTFIRLLFVIGAGIAVKKSQSLILQIVNPQAAQQSDQAMGNFMAAAMAAKSMASGAMGAMKGGKK